LTMYNGQLTIKRIFNFQFSIFNYFTFRLSLIIFLCLFYFVTPAYAENKQPPVKSIDVDSDSFDMLIKDSLMTFSKNVRIKSNNFEANCDKALVYLEAKTGKVKKIVMSGKVKLQKDNSQINGEKVTFETDNEKLTVEGSVKTKIRFGE
jgi:lipopolysaccharide export system protein LptA